MDIAVWNSIFLAVIYFLYFAVILTTIFVVILDNRSPVKTMAWILVFFSSCSRMDSVLVFRTQYA